MAYSVLVKLRIDQQEGAVFCENRKTSSSQMVYSLRGLLHVFELQVQLTKGDALCLA